MPITVTITAEPSGSVVARGGDSLAITLLNHAGFAFTNDWHGPRHRLPTTMDRTEQRAIASHATEMLRAARYHVALDPALSTTLANPLGSYTVGAELLQLTDQIRSAENGTELLRAVDHLLHPEHGALERLREALEAASEQITDLDDEAYQLSDRFGFAADFVSAAQSELTDCEAELHRTDTSTQVAAPTAQIAAVATSPAAAKAKAPSTPDPWTASVSVPPAQSPGPRKR
ncbi:hypothetical protein ABH940_003467 [Streptacidiphilus sp. BW17]|uniref:hypothetical protein n=1 Tax=Streptacidiphilus sp. BW17 TaxID=3156274 RepID=UPI0035160668